jgi:antibiotic biosynthesis monooxygenase (ABM) superfamily enzyme
MFQPTESQARPWLVLVATTLAAWLVAFGVVLALLTLFGDELASLPLALRALVMSGVLVALMVNLVMPIVSVAVARWVAGTTKGPPNRGRLTVRSGGESRA